MKILILVTALFCWFVSGQEDGYIDDIIDHRLKDTSDVKESDENIPTYTVYLDEMTTEDSNGRS